MSEPTSAGPSNGPWIPLESNPEVFNTWAKKAGLLTSQFQFEDVYGFDEDLLSLVPQPVQAIVLLFPIQPDTEARAKEEDEKIAKKGQPKIDKTIFWVKQTISNACGTIALIHALANSSVAFSPNSLMQQFIFECKDKSPLERAKFLETSSPFTSIHSETAQSGQTATPTILDTDLHFTCFVAAPEAEFRDVAEGKAPRPDFSGEGGEVEGKKSGMRLIELDGRRNGPIDHGECTDLLRNASSVIKERYMSSTSSLNFSLMALAPTAQDLPEPKNKEPNHM
ncbi:ubiquitin carboxyl-terminal hydrolase [Cyathus striatus]|nr:ubiquitin carboxyl-terminal hydrolase [Cyathus striatus]